MPFGFFLLLSKLPYEDHSDYLKSWISVLRDDYNELFRACADAEKISDRLIGNYCKKYDLEREAAPVPDRFQEKDGMSRETMVKCI